MFVAIWWSVLVTQSPYAPYSPSGAPIVAPAAIAVPAPLLSTQPETAHFFLFDHDANRDGVLTINEIPERLRGAFERTDTDGNGKLDAREILTGATRISREARRVEGLRVNKRDLERGPNGEKVVFRVPASLLQRLDQNRDGYADARELGTLLQQPGIVFGDPPYSMTPADIRAMASAAPARIGGSIVPQAVGTPSAIAGPSPVAPNASTNGMIPPLNVPSPQAAGMIPAPQTGTMSPAPIATARPTPAVASINSPFMQGLEGPSSQLPARPDAAEVVNQRTIEPVTPTPAPKKSTPPSASSAPAKGGGLGPDGMPDAATILQHLDKNGNGQLDRNEAVDQLADNFDRLDRNRDGMLSEQEIKRGLALARMFGIKPKQDPRAYRSQ